jgi:hypothetical protein
MRSVIFVLMLAACGDEGPATVGDPMDDPQLPPRGSADLMTWIEQGHYLAWTCEPDRHPPRPGSGHSANRICTNDVMAADTGDGPFAVGSAAVKEVFDGDDIAVYAVYRKVTAGDGGNTWYWFEGSRDQVVANGEGDSTCTGCHGAAPRDFSFTVVR